MSVSEEVEGRLWVGSGGWLGLCWRWNWRVRWSWRWIYDSQTLNDQFVSKATLDLFTGLIFWDFPETVEWNSFYERHSGRSTVLQRTVMHSGFLT